MKIKVNNTATIFSTVREEYNETNDCTVRATAIALNQSYEETHRQYKEAGRRNRRGTGTYTIKEVLKNNLIGFNPNTSWEMKSAALGDLRKCPTISQLLKRAKFQVGTHIILTRNHAFTIKNGEVFGNSNDDGRARVEGYLTTETGIIS